ncbi:MAG: alpha/beta hydrolase [Pseudomonadota bacterium]
MNPLLRQFFLAGFSALCAFTASAWAQENTSTEQVMVGGLARDADRPLESIPGVTSHYGMVETSDGARLRTIITVPDGADAPLHPILFTQWVSCGSVEYREGGSRGILGKLAQESGLSLVRVERSSDGDSMGPACDELDYDTEVAHYVEAYESLLQDERLDANKVYVYGSSLGSTTAPLVAKTLQDNGYDIAGVAIQGGGAETYYERMLTFDRLYLERRPQEVAPEEIHDEMIRRAKFHYEYLINDRDPDEIAADNEAMALARAGIRGMEDGAHYGRPYAWHQQASKHNFLAAWAALEAPVLVIYNEFDQFEAQYGHQVIADMVNRLRPRTATFVVQENIGHSNDRFATVEDAYVWRSGEAAWEQTANVILRWLCDIR